MQEGWEAVEFDGTARECTYMKTANCTVFHD